jgi:hypothetical protein
MSDPRQNQAGQGAREEIREFNFPERSCASVSLRFEIGGKGAAKLRPGEWS